MSKIEPLVGMAGMAECIEHIFKRPQMHATTAECLETAFFIAFSMWNIAQGSKYNIQELWRAEVPKAYPDSLGYSTVSLARPPVEWAKERNLEDLSEYGKSLILMPIVIHGMRHVWETINPPEVL